MQVFQVWGPVSCLTNPTTYTKPFCRCFPVPRLLSFAAVPKAKLTGLLPGPCAPAFPIRALTQNYGCLPLKLPASALSKCAAQFPQSPNIHRQSCEKPKECTQCVGEKREATREERAERESSSACSAQGPVLLPESLNEENNLYSQQHCHSSGPANLTVNYLSMPGIWKVTPWALCKLSFLCSESHSKCNQHKTGRIKNTHCWKSNLRFLLKWLPALLLSNQRHTNKLFPKIWPTDCILCIMGIPKQASLSLPRRTLI